MCWKGGSPRVPLQRESHLVSLQPQFADHVKKRLLTVHQTVLHTGKPPPYVVSDVDDPLRFPLLIQASAIIPISPPTAPALSGVLCWPVSDTTRAYHGAPVKYSSAVLGSTTLPWDSNHIWSRKNSDADITLRPVAYESDARPACSRRGPYINRSCRSRRLHKATHGAHAPPRAGRAAGRSAAARRPGAQHAAMVRHFG